jgi:hypothetical protein
MGMGSGSVRHVGAFAGGGAIGVVRREQQQEDPAWRRGDDANGDLVLNDGLVVLAENIDIEFLRDNDEWTDVLICRQT